MKKEEIEEAEDLPGQLRLIAKCLPASPFKEKVKEVTEAAIAALREAEESRDSWIGMYQAARENERERCASAIEQSKDAHRQRKGNSGRGPDFEEGYIQAHADILKTLEFCWSKGVDDE